MERALATLSSEEFEELIERTIDRRLEAWLTQLMDALTGWQTTDEDNLERFIGMWADFTPEEDRVFQTILEERASYFSGREIELGKGTELQPEFAASLRQSLEQARSGEGIDLRSFRDQIGRVGYNRGRPASAQRFYGINNVV